MLDVEDPIPGNYQLEVTSPGIDGPWSRSTISAGSPVRGEDRTGPPGRWPKRFRGRLALPDVPDRVVLLDEAGRVTLPFDEILRAKLVLTDGCIAATQAHHRPPRPPRRTPRRVDIMEQSLAARPELLQVADTVARDKGIERDEVLEAMEQAIQKAGRSKYGHEHDIRAEIDPQDRRNSADALHRGGRDGRERGDADDASTEAQTHNPEAQVGDFIIDPLPPIDFGRIAAQTAKQVIVQRVRDAERQRQFNEFKDRIGEIVNGLVKRVEYGNVVVDLGRAEAMLRRDELIPRENFRTRRAGPRLYLRRPPGAARAADFPVADPSAIHGQVVRAGSAGNLRRHHRDQGGCPRSRASRAKIAVISRDIRHRSGRRLRRHARQSGPGGRGRAAGREDRHHSVVVRSGNLRRQCAGAGRSGQGGARRGPATASRWWCPTTSCRLAIGRRGQNVRLASQLTGWDIDILTEAEESRTPDQKNSEARSSLFIDALDVDE